MSITPRAVVLVYCVAAALIAVAALLWWALA